MDHRAEAKIQDIMERMSLEEKVGQLFMVGFGGPQIDEQIEEMVVKYRVGGVIYFSRNIQSPAQIGRLSLKLQRLAVESDSLPLLIATDQEGGVITRITGATHYPGNMMLGAAGSSRLAFRTGQMTARELKACGINMNLAPVLDVNNNPANPVIGVRSFGEDPELVADLGAAYIKGLTGEGVSACAKHFPGHGDTAVDSHYSIPVVKHDREHLEGVELYPFRRAIKEGLESLMTTHIYFPAVEPAEGIPATLSRRVIEHLLRKELGFEGLVITDCLEMKAISESVGTASGAALTIRAGCDIALISHTFSRQKAAIETVLKAVRQGMITRERLDQSVSRIISLKFRKFNRLEEQISPQLHNHLHPKGIPAVDPDFFPNREGEELAYRTALQGLTLFRNQKGLVPLKKAAGKQVLVLGPVVKHRTIAEDDSLVNNLFPAYLKANGLTVDQFIPGICEEGLKEQIVERYNPLDYDLIVFMSYNAAADREQIRLVKELEQEGLPLVVVAIRNPYDLQAFNRVSTYLITYDYSPPALVSAADVICGKERAGGKTPVTILLPEDH